MHHTRRIAAVIAIAVAVTAGVWALWLYAGPGLVKRYAAVLLRDLGFSRVRIEAATVRPASVVLEGIRAEPALAIDSAAVMFGFSSLLQRRATAIRLYGGVTRMGVDARGVRWPPFEQPDTVGRGRIPFSHVTIIESVVWLVYREHRIRIPLRGRIERAGRGRVRIDATAAPVDAQLAVEATIDLARAAGTYRLGFRGVGGEAARLIGSLWPDLPDMSLSGSVGGEARLDIDKGEWRLRGRLGGTHAVVEAAPADIGLRFSPDSVTFSAAGNGVDTGRIRVSGRLDGGRLNADVSLDRTKRRVRTVLRGKGMAAAYAAQLIERFTGVRVPGADGTFGFRAHVTLSGDSAEVRLRVDAGKTVLRVQRDTGAWRMYPSALEADLAVGRGARGWRLARIRADVHEVGLGGDDRSVRIGRMSTSLRSSARDSVFRGTVGVRQLVVEKTTLPDVAGTVTVGKRELRFELAGEPLPQAELLLTGRFRWNGEGLTGAAHGVVPRFRLSRYRVRGADWWPFAGESVLSGGYRLEGRAVFRAGRLDYWTGIDMRDATWRRRDPQVGIVGLDGAVAFVGFVPPVTARAYELTFDSVYAGLLRAGAGGGYLSAGAGAPVLVRDVRCGWAGGTLHADSIRIYPDRSVVALTVRLETVEVQRIIDAFEYRGVRGTGTVSGVIALRIGWKPNPRVAVLGGTLEAGPSPGTLSLSAETARAVLGIEDGFAPDDPTLEQEVTLLILEALQDLVYTRLRLSFEKSGDREGSLTRIEIRGSGPRGVPQRDQIPIGGLTINIYGSDRLLNGLLFGGLGGADIEIR